jgi:hypothetical protein
VQRKCEYYAKQGSIDESESSLDTKSQFLFYSTINKFSLPFWKRTLQRAVDRCRVGGRDLCVSQSIRDRRLSVSMRQPEATVQAFGSSTHDAIRTNRRKAIIAICPRGIFRWGASVITVPRSTIDRMIDRPDFSAGHTSNTGSRRNMNARSSSSSDGRNGC